MIGSIKTYEENVAVYHTSIYRRYFMLFKSENSKLAEKAILGVCFLEKGGGCCPFDCKSSFGAFSTIHLGAYSNVGIPNICMWLRGSR